LRGHYILTGQTHSDFHIGGGIVDPEGRRFLTCWRWDVW